MPQPPTTQHFIFAPDWRVCVWFQNGDGYRAWFEHFTDGAWLLCRPIVASRRSPPVVLERFVDGHRGLADATEKLLSFSSSGRIGGGCPHCAYTHIYIMERGGRIAWSCPSCGRHGGKPYGRL